MPDQNIINQLEPTNDILDYAFLKKVGLEEIQQLAGKVWTDYNFHDPGITILEILSFALTELGYKSNYPVKDILATKGSKKTDTLYPPSKILPSDPITLTDFHKIILDIDGIKDVIIFPSKKFVEFTGVYDINIELYPEFDHTSYREEVKGIVFEEAHMNRSLCEDIFEVNFIDHEKVIFEIDVSVNDKQDLSDIYLKIYEELIEYISPAAKFNSLQEMLDLGYTVDEIYSGPFLKSGFLTEDEFERLDTRNVISASDIIHFIMDIEGVEMINTLNIIDKDGNKHQWVLSVEKGMAFEVDTSKTTINFFKFGKRVKLKDDLTQEIRKIEKKEDNRLRFKKLSFDEIEGNYRRLRKFHTIQNDFPEIYGIGELGLPTSATNSRKAQAKQLKAYLMFFEQILTNFYAQLANLNDLFSIDKISNTYYGQALLDIPGIESLYKPFITKCIKKHIDIHNTKILKAEWRKHIEENRISVENVIEKIIESEETFYDRRNRVLDHLLGRMAFNFSDYYYDYQNDSENSTDVIEHKKEVLKDFIRLSKERNSSEFFIDPSNPAGNKISGIEFIINNLLKLSGNSENFPFDYYRKSIGISKTEDNEKPSKESYSFNFKNTTKRGLMKDMFRNATNKERYKYLNGEVSICHENAESFATLQRKVNTKEEAKNYIEKISSHFDKISKESEAIFVIERLLYRPLPEMKYFTFSILDDNEQPVFINNGYLTYKAREERVETIIKQGQNAANYTSKLISGQYKIILQDSKGEEILTSHHFFNTEKALNKAIKEQALRFEKIDRGEEDEVKFFNFYTKHYDLFHLVKNPYSFIVTILIPDWPEKLQNNAFRSHLINIIHKEVPAHLAVDIKVVDIVTLTSIIDLCSQYKTMIREEKPDYTQLEKISDEMFGYFLEY